MRFVMLVLGIGALFYSLIAALSPVTVVGGLAETVECGSALAPDDTPGWTSLWGTALDFEATRPSDGQLQATCDDPLRDKTVESILVFGAGAMSCVFAGVRIHMHLQHGREVAAQHRWNQQMAHQQPWGPAGPIYGAPPPYMGPAGSGGPHVEQYPGQQQWGTFRG